MQIILAVLGSLLMLAPAQAQQPARPMRLVTQFGGVNDDNANLSEVTALIVGAGDTLFVAQPKDNLVRVFARDGRSLRTIGRSGSGPGEFRSISAMGWIGDSLWVGDNAQRRFTLLTQGGRVLRTIPYPSLPPSRVAVRPVALMRGNTLLAREVLNSNDLAAGVPRRASVLVARTDGSDPRTITALSVSKFTHLVPRGPSHVMLTSDLMSRTFSDDSLLRLVPDGSGFIVVSRPIAANVEAGRYQVTRYGPDGRVQWSRGHDYRPRRVATVHGRSVHASMVDTYTSLGVFPTRAQVDAMVRDNFPVPGFYPPVTDAVIGRDDTVWLRGPETLDSTIEWTVLNAQGGLLERVILPSAVTVRDARGVAVWGVVLDPDGLPVIVRYVTP